MLFSSLIRTHAPTVLLVIGCCSYTFFRRTRESSGGDRQDFSSDDLSSDDYLGPYERYRRDVLDEDYDTDPESDDNVSDPVGDKEDGVRGRRGAAKNRRGRRIPIPDQPPQLIIHSPGTEAESSGEEVEQKITNRESQIRPFMEAPPEDDEQEGIEIPPPSFLVQTPSFKIPMVPMIKPNPLLVNFNRLIVDLPAIDPPLMIPNLDQQPLFSPNLRRPPPPDSTGGSSSTAAGKDSQKTEHSDPQPPLPPTLSPLPPSDSTGRSRAVTVAVPQVIDVFQNVDDQQPPLSPTLRLPPPPDGRSVPPGDESPEIEQQGDGKRQKLN